MAAGDYKGGGLDNKRNDEILAAQLESERSSFLSQWRDCNDHVLPRRARFTVTDTNQGDRRNSKIVDTTPSLAARTLRAGMTSGVTPPARPWFRLTTSDPDLAEVGSVKQWLYLVSQRMTAVFLKSNLYNVLPIIYGDIGVFGTAAMSIEEDFNDVIRCYPFPIGSYYISNNDRLKVDTFVRDFRMTVRQLIERFSDPVDVDWDIFSSQVRSLYDAGQLEAWIEVRHVIRPNPDYDPQMELAKYKKYRSCYYERSNYGSGNATYITQMDGKYLQESGYDYFPVLCPRWEVTGEDSYGTDCPAMTALGDIKQLMLGEKRAAQAIEKMVNPPMVGPTALRGHKTSILPGDITWVDEREGQKGFRPAHEINFRIQELEAKQEQIRDRINRAFFVDLFLMLSQSDRSGVTAREIEERHEEKLLAVGPVLEQLNQDLLDPLIDITFNIMGRQGLIPEPPEELQGQDLKVEYVSIMAQAQKLVGIAGIERFAQFWGGLMPVAPEAKNKVNVAEMVDVYAEITSIPPGIVRTDEEMAAIEAQQQKQMAAQAAAAQAEQMAAAANKLGNTPMDTNNALTQMLGQSQAGQAVPI